MEKSNSKNDYFPRGESKHSGGGGLMKQATGNGRSKGVLPVKVEMPNSGKEFKFEQLLVAEKPITLAADYKEIVKGVFGKRSTRVCC